MDTRMRGYDRVLSGYGIGVSGSDKVVLGSDKVVLGDDRIVRGCGNAQDVLGGGCPCGRMVEWAPQNALPPAVNGLCGKVGI
jgi:hypothetical protein